MENIQASKQFCIVYDNETLPMANSLFNRVKEKGYSCVTWSEEQYRDQKPTLENDEQQNKILFLSRKCVKDCFSNPSLKPLFIVHGYCRIFQEGINAGIAAIKQSGYTKIMCDDKFLTWTYDSGKKWREWVFGIPAGYWAGIRGISAIFTPSLRRKMRELILFNALDVFYDYYLDDFMKGTELLPIEGVTVYR